MQILIIYFSGTGNTRLITREIASRLRKNGNEVEIVSVENVEKLRELDFSNKIIGFGYPVYKFLYPDIFNRFFPLINNLGRNNKYFIFSTYTRFAANTFYYFSKKIDHRKFRLIADESFKCPSCGIAARKDANDFKYESVMFFEDNIKQKLDNFVDGIMDCCSLNNFEIRHKRNVFDVIKLPIIKDIEKTKYPKLEINSAKCSVCELCARKCPDNNLKIRADYIEIGNAYDCLHCLRCMNHCPQNAISFGNLTFGDNQYTLKTRDVLFEKAISGFKEKYWSNFNEIVKDWRKKTVKYWLKNRFL